MREGVKAVIIGSVASLVIAVIIYGVAVSQQHDSLEVYNCHHLYLQSQVGMYSNDAGNNQFVQKCQADGLWN